MRKTLGGSRVLQQINRTASVSEIEKHWLFYNSVLFIAQDSDKSHHVHPAQYPDNAAWPYRTSDCRHPSAEQEACRSSRRDIHLSMSKKD